MSEVLAPAVEDLGSVGAGTSVIDLSKGTYKRLTLTAATRTIADPVVSATSRVQGQMVLVADPVQPGAEDVEPGTLLFIEIKNNSGGAVTVTYGSAFRGTPTAPTSTNGRTYTFQWDGSFWRLISDGAVVPN
jgi:hypothetical protein